MNLKQWAIDWHKKNNQNPLVAKALALATQSIAFPAALLSFLAPRHYSKTHIRWWCDKQADRIHSKHIKYLKLIEKHQDKNGFILTHECDATLFSGLISAAGTSVNMTAARDKTGAWMRRPLSYEACWYDGKGKSSTISRDMLIGVMWHCWANKDLDTANDLFEYGKKNHWVMGKGDFSRIIFTPALQAVLAEVIYRLGGKNHRIYRKMPQFWPINLVGYEMHLQMLTIELIGQMFGGVLPEMAIAVSNNARREPYNPFALFLKAKYIDGNYSAFANSILDISVWPADRLPTNRDRKADWLFQQPYYKNGAINPAWLPELADMHEHTGGDFLFISFLFLDEIGLLD